MSAGTTISEVAKKQLRMTLLPEMKVKSPALYKLYVSVDERLNPWKQIFWLFWFSCAGAIISFMHLTPIFLYVALGVVIWILLSRCKTICNYSRPIFLSIFIVTLIFAIYFNAFSSSYLYAYLSFRIGGYSSTTSFIFFFGIAFYYLIKGHFHQNILEKSEQWKNSIIWNYQERKAELERVDSMRMVSIDEKVKSGITVGDIIINGSKNPVVIGSRSVEIVQGTKDPNLAKALTFVVGHLEENSNRESAEIFNKFVDQLNQKEPDKTILKALWDAVVSAAPTLKEMAAATAAITNIFT